MEEIGNKDQGKKKIYDVRTYPVPFPLRGNQGNLTIHTNTPSKEQIINQAFQFHSQGNILEAAKLYQYFINQGFTDHRVFSNYGTIFKNLGKLKEAEISLRKAIEIKPDYAEAHSNLGNIFNDLGKLNDAANSYRRVIDLKPLLVEAKINLNAIAVKEVPRWHIPMINDYERNNSYFNAIKCAIKDNEYVLEIGTGSGLLSMMAIDAGAKKVITCETNKSLSEIAKKIIKKNGYPEKITVINKKSTELNLDTDLPQKADLIISEIFSSELVGEGIQSSILDAKERLLKEDGKMIPEAGEIKFALLQSNSNIEDLCFTGTVNGYDLSDFNQVTGNKFIIPVHHSNISFLSNINTAFSFDFYSENLIKRKEKIIKISVSKSGICLGLITWIKVNLYQNIYLENNPSCFNDSHWSTPIYTFEKPLRFSKGDIISIKATLLEDKVWFELMK